MNISIIIPTCNEAEHIASLIQSFHQYKQKASLQIIVTDGGSSDNTVQIAKQAGADIVVISPEKGRAAQMNHGVLWAKYNLLYFVHADVKINPDFVQDIEQSLQQGYDMGCYRYVFDSSHLLLKVNAFFTRFPFIWCRGGDQTLFVKRSVFNDLCGYYNMQIMEEYDFIQRAILKGYRFKIIPKNVVVSARKYETNSYFKVLYANYKVMRLWKQQKASDNELAILYKQMLNYR